MVLHCAILLIIYSFYNIKFYSGQKTSIQWFVGADPVNAKRWEFFLTQFSIWGGGGGWRPKMAQTVNLCSICSNETVSPPPQYPPLVSKGQRT